MSLTPWIATGIAAAAAVAGGAVAAYLNAARLRELAAAKAECEQIRSELSACSDRTIQLTAEYDALVSGCRSGVFVLDGSDVIQRASPEACRMLGLLQKHVEGRSLLQVTLSAELQTSLRAAREANSVQHCEIRVPGPAGSCMSITIVPVSREVKPAARFLVIAADVTELRRLETVRRDFVANVSHELRTPLTSIRAMAETLQAGALDDREVADHFLGTIATEVQRLTRISEDLLVLSHAESSMAESRLLSLSSLLTNVVNRFIRQAENHGVELRLDTPPMLDILGSKDQIEQVLINLVDNAIKYTHEGGRVCITAESVDGMAAVHIADTGIGIMNQDLSRIFERFYRVDKARSRESGGTGLGLSIVKHIVEAHGGRVTVQSEYNRGSTFSISLPCA